ncbi:MAG: DEAD/DEAH box helicase [Thaumarchaeota archaeon]|nr:DEAD/DEAH box helicase [Nitrososphaerota archaeon]
MSAPASAFTLLSKEVREAVRERGIEHPTPPQKTAIPRILGGENVLIVAPTGSGKTEAALLPIFSLFAQKKIEDGIAALYVTPLRALNRDVLKRISYWSGKLGFSLDIRHGDTSVQDRRRQAAKPPVLLVTTPETLQAILPGSRMRSHLKNLRWVIVDEVHQLVGNRRGVQLAVALGRLRQLVKPGFQIIGLSATLGNPQEAGMLLVGSEGNITVEETRLPKEYRYFIEHPYASGEDHRLAQTLFTSPDAASRISRICEIVESHESTLIFVNSRSVAEMLGSRLGMLRKDVAVHHGSLSREERARAEEEFKGNRLRGLVSTSTLELGIDIGSVDNVVQYMSPRQASALIQRVGRSGHRLDRISIGTIIAVSTDDVLESAAVVARAEAGKLEALLMHRNSLDVLAHQTVGVALDFQGGILLDKALKIMRGAYPYSDLGKEQFTKVVEYLHQLGILRSEGRALRATRKGRFYYFENLSMIPDEKRYPVMDLATQKVVGTLGDEFVSTKARVGLNFICRGRVWRIQKIADDGFVYVLPVEDPTAAIPGWDGEIIPLPFDIAQQVGALRQQISDLLGQGDISHVVAASAQILPAEKNARKKVVEDIAAYQKLGAHLPTDSRIVLEAAGRFLVIHCCFGDAVNRTLGYVFDEVLSDMGVIRFWWSDGYRLLIELNTGVESVSLEALKEKLFSLADRGVEDLFSRHIENQFPFAYYLKFVAGRFGAMKRGGYVDGATMAHMPRRFRNTPIYDEALREGMLEKVDLAKTKEIFQKIKDGTIPVELWRAGEQPTPFAYSILYRYAEAPELMTTDFLGKGNIERMKTALYSEYVNLLCFQCSHLDEAVGLDAAGEAPKCKKCGSGLLAPVQWGSQMIKKTLRKKMTGQPLEEDEKDALSKARRSADLVLSYGRKGILAQLVYGVGQTASRILARMHDDEESFFKDLLDAKLRFITTRPFWKV